MEFEKKVSLFVTKFSSLVYEKLFLFLSILLSRSVLEGEEKMFEENKVTKPKT